jgi:hypothetical protein
MRHSRLSEREFQRYAARVYLTEARRRQVSQPEFSRELLQWAKNARNRSNALRPAQGELFGRAAA